MKMENKNKTNALKHKISISESGKYFVDDIEIDDRVFDDEKTDYIIKERDEFIDTLIDWISECDRDKEGDKFLMKTDLKILIKRNDEFMLSSISTNEYLFEGDDDFNFICEEILKLNEGVKNECLKK